MNSRKENTRICCMCGSSPSKDPSITLHRFPKPGPKNALRCELWSKYCFPNEAWSSPQFQGGLYSKHKMLCSKHFISTCFIEKKLFRTAVPGVQCQKVDNTDFCDGGDNDDDDDDSDTLVESNVCRVCLALDVKLYDLKDIALRETFQNITGIAVTENNHPILERLCWECAGRLRAAAAFRHKALLSDALLQRIASTGEHVRKNDITSIKEKEDYLKSAATLSIVEVFHTVEIDPDKEEVFDTVEIDPDNKEVFHTVEIEPDNEEVFHNVEIDPENEEVFHTVEIDPDNESLPAISEKHETKMLQNTQKDMIEVKESIIEENNDEMDLEDESMNEAPIKNIIPETYSRVSNNIPLREDTINPAYSSPLPGCSNVVKKYKILGYLPKTYSKDKIKKTVIKITKRDSIPKKKAKKPKEIIAHDQIYLKGVANFKNINVKVVGITKKTSSQKLVKKSPVKENMYTDVEYLDLEE